MNFSIGIKIILKKNCKIYFILDFCQFISELERDDFGAVDTLFDVD